MTSRSRELAFRAIAVALGIALPIAVVEGLSSAGLSIERRLYKPELPESVAATINDEDRHIPTVDDAYLGFRVKPDVDWERVQTNAMGLRAGPVSEHKPAGSFRVLLLGGSVAWGYTATSNRDTIAAYLEQELRERASGVPALAQRPIEVLNGGVPSYVAWQEALAYAIDRYRLEPDWVVTLDGTNDVEAAIRNGEAGVPMRYALTRGAYLGTSPSLFDALASWLRLRFQELKAVKLLAKLRPKPLSELSPPAPEATAAALRDAEAYLARTASAHGARLLAVLQPMAILPDTKPLTDFERQVVAHHDRRLPGRNAYYAAAYAALRPALESLARDSGGEIAVLDATRVYAATPDPTYTDHCHLTPLGRQLLARAIASRLIEALGGHGDSVQRSR